MSHAEVDRLQVVQKITAKQITQVDAAQLLGISYRQVKRIVNMVPSALCLSGEVSHQTTGFRLN